jgi:phosphoenolpyruvate phosphomutase
MIHSKETSPIEILEFCKLFRQKDSNTPIVAVPSTYNQITSTELSNAGVNIVIYANQLIRSAFPAMEKTAKRILEFGRTYEIESELLPIDKIISMID